jgi:hypothetical protein
VGWVCGVCGDEHDEALRDIRLALPEPVFRLDELARAELAEVSDDWCRMLEPSGRTRRFVRGLLHLPVRGEQRDFRFGIWVEVDVADFERLGDLWDDPDGSESAPVFGTLANELTPYAGTLGLPVALQLRDVPILPAVIVLDSAHPLGSDQRSGIGVGRANAVAETVLH